MADIPKTYASPGLRWGLFRHDHPNAPDPTFRLARYDDPDVNVPEEWATGGDEDFTGEFCVCTVDPGDGGPKVTAWREIPSRERRGGSWKPYPKTPENWRKLTTMALGRCLKQLGLADDTEDLKALLLWRRRDVELKALAAGVSPPPALGSAPTEADLDAAAKPQPLAEHPEHPGHDDHPDPGDEITVDTEDQWNPATASVLRPLVEQLSEADRVALQEYADSKGYGPYVSLAGGPLRAVRARAAAMLPKRAPGADGPPEGPGDLFSPAPGPPSPGSEASGPSAQPRDPDRPAQRAKVMALHRAIVSIEDGELLNSILDVAPGLAELNEDTPLTLGEVAQAWDILRNHGVEG